MSTERLPTPFIIAGKEYADRRREDTPFNGATHEQLEFLGRLAQNRRPNFKFSSEELSRIEELETAIAEGRAVLVGGVAVAAIGEKETHEEVTARLFNTATYGAALIGDWARVGHKAWVGDGARVGYRATVGDSATVGHKARVGDGARVGDWATVGDSAGVGDWAEVVSNTLIPAGGVVEPRAIAVPEGTNVQRF